MVNNKLNKEAKHTLDLALKVLEHAMELASEKEDLEAIIAQRKVARDYIRANTLVVDPVIINT